ncbi:MAG: TetR/AcrR family transcriptional regulator, partial [Acidimicrobiales bacterium]
MTPQYHHGDLPNALRFAAAEVIAEKGLGAFSLREVARRAKVSHTAPAHHFGDMTGLLTSLAVTGFDALHEAELEAINPDDSAAQRLASIARAYVELAQQNPGFCEVMFRVDVVDVDDPALQAAGMRSF